MISRKQYGQLFTAYSISVREGAARDYIKSNTGLNVPVVLDPTMLLSENDWKDLLKNSNNLFQGKKKYIFTYFLSKPSKKMNVLMKDLKKKGYAFVNFNSKKPFSRKYYGLGPDDFVMGIASSNGVLTDSFHASVFAILFQKPFYIDPNRFGGTMSARIDTLLENTSLESRRLSPASGIRDFWNVNYAHALENLENLRSSSLEYLKKSVES